ncbi:MAG: hypothetical protein GX267_14075 [Fibrobacter sp.]|nr:hypothetical protein [Fibrobacter sp.]
MGILKSAFFQIIFSASILIFQFCTPVVAPHFTLPKPTIQTVKLDISNRFKEAIHINWSMPQAGSSEIQSYTLLRMFESDSFYSVLSENIPPDTFNFYDHLDPASFPLSSIERNLVYYRIFAIDKSGFSGDTSEPCTLCIVQQSSLIDIDLNTGCISWFSDLHFGGLLSYCKIWKDSLQKSITGSELTAYPQTDKPAIFTTCFPADSIDRGRWFYALFVRSSDCHSLKVGYFDVP